MEDPSGGESSEWVRIVDHLTRALQTMSENGASLSRVIACQNSELERASAELARLREENASLRLLAVRPRPRIMLPYPPEEDRKRARPAAVEGPGPRPVSQ